MGGSEGKRRRWGEAGWCASTDSRAMLSRLLQLICGRSEALIQANALSSQVVIGLSLEIVTASYQSQYSAVHLRDQ